MRYVCTICGYIYDEEKEGASFASLPDGWKCPRCGAPKSVFEPADSPKPQPSPPKGTGGRYVCTICGYIYDEEKEGALFASLPDGWKCPRCGASKFLFEREKPLEEDLQPLSPGVLAALCSNLARGSEKQYKEEEAALFREIAGYFASAAPAEPDAGMEELVSLLREDLEEGYPALDGAAQAENDRGTRRICVWGEKVTRMLYALAVRCREEGTGFLRDTQVWVCSICGFIYIGDTPPDICPVCKVPAWKFEKVEGRASK